MKEQYVVECIDENTGDRTVVWEGNKRYFATLEEAKKVLENSKRSMREKDAIKLGNGLYVSIEENLGAKFEWQIFKRFVTEWEEVNE